MAVDKSRVVTVVLCTSIAFGGFLIGWDLCTPGGYAGMPDFQKRFGEYDALTQTYALSKTRTGLVTGSYNIGATVGPFFFSWLTDLKGRRAALITGSVVYIIGVIVSISTDSKWYQFVVGRVITGLGMGSISFLSPTFVSEISPKNIRGFLVGIFQLLSTLSLFLGYCTLFGTHKRNDSGSWRIPLGLSIAWALILTVGIIFAPESPRFLLNKGRTDEAIKSIAKIESIKDLNGERILREVEEIENQIKQENAEGDSSWKEAFTGKPHVPFRFLAGFLTQSFLMFSGITYFFYYTSTIFASVGLSDSYMAGVIIGTVYFVCSFPSLYLIDALGRRRLLMIGSTAMAICLFIFTCVGSYALFPNGESQPASKQAGNVMICFASFFVAAYSSSWGSCAYVIIAEIFPSRLRAKGMALALAANWGWSFGINFIAPFVTGIIGFKYGFVFSGMTVLAIFFVYFCLPETSGLSLEEISLSYQMNVPAWKTRNWVPPKDEKAEAEA